MAEETNAFGFTVEEESEDEEVLDHSFLDETHYEAAHELAK